MDSVTFRIEIDLICIYDLESISSMSFEDRDLDNSFDKELRDKNSILTLDFMLPAIVLVLPCGIVSGLHFMFKRECLINSELILVRG